jgi:hypothetical protein
MLEGGSYASIGDLAQAEGVNFSLMCRMLRLTVLAPEVVGRLLDGKQEGRTTSQRSLLPGSSDAVAPGTRLQPYAYTSRPAFERRVEEGLLCPSTSRCATRSW